LIPLSRAFLWRLGAFLSTARASVATTARACAATSSRRGGSAGGAPGGASGGQQGSRLRKPCAAFHCIEGERLGNMGLFGTPFTPESREELSERVYIELPDRLCHVSVFPRDEIFCERTSELTCRGWRGG